jgi:hypothetical protein
LDVRSFLSAIDALINGELLGKEARGGKVAGMAMVNYLKSETPMKFKKYSKKEIIDDNTGNIRQDFINDFFVIIQQLKRVDKIDKSEIDKIKTEKQLTEIINDMLKKEYNGDVYKLGASLNSKIQAMQVATYATDKFFEFVYSYAASLIKGISGPFIKIGK